MDDITLELAEMAAIRREIGKSTCPSFRLWLRGFSYGTIGKCKKLKTERALVFSPFQIADLLEEHGFVDSRYYDRDTLVSLLDDFLRSNGWEEKKSDIDASIELPELGLYATRHSVEALMELSSWWLSASLEYAPPFQSDDGLSLYVDGKRLLCSRELFAFGIPKERVRPFAATIEVRSPNDYLPEVKVVLPESMSAVVSDAEALRTKEPGGKA